MKKKVGLIIGFFVVCSLAAGLLFCAYAFERVDSLAELKEPRLYVHFLDIEGGEIVYLQLPDAGEVLIMGTDREVSETVKKYLQRQFQLRNGRIAFGLSALLGWKQRVDLLLNTYLHKESFNSLLNLYKDLDIRTIISGMSSHTPVSLTHLPLEIGQFAYLVSTYGRYYAIKGGYRVPLPPQQRVRVDLEVLGPRQIISYSECLNNYKRADWRDENSLVLKLSFNKVSFLFPSFLSLSAQEELVKASGEKLAANILRAPAKAHPEFLAGVDPEILIFTQGKEKIDKELLAFSEGKHTHFTPGLRAIVVVTDGEKVCIITEQR